MFSDAAILLVALSAAPAQSDVLPNVSGEPDPYARPQLDLLLGLASDRPLDGVDYFGGEALVIAGLRFSIPEGFYMASQLLHGKGNGRLLPATDITLLETAAGWTARAGDHGLALELQDYRNHLAGHDRFSHAGVAGHYRYRNFSAEAGIEFEQSYYYRPLDRFFDYDTRRLVIAQEFPVSREAAFGVSVGSKKIDRIELSYQFVEARFRWHWQDLEWQLAYNHLSDDVKEFYPATTDTGLVHLRVTRRFGIFPDP